MKEFIMKKLVAIIGQGADDYGVYTEQVKGLYGAGETLEAAKRNFEEAIQIYREEHQWKDIPLILQDDCEIEYQLFEAYVSVAV